MPTANTTKLAQVAAPLALQSQQKLVTGLGVLFHEIAEKLDTARSSLIDGGPNSAELVIDVLSLVGWMADRGAQLAGHDTPVGGSADNWLLSANTAGELGL